MGTGRLLCTQHLSDNDHSFGQFSGHTAKQLPGNDHALRASLLSGGNSLSTRPWEWKNFVNDGIDEDLFKRTAPPPTCDACA